MSFPTWPPHEIDVTAPVVVHHETAIAAPLQEVWNRHIDVDGWPGWYPDMTSAHIAGSFDPGTTFDWESYNFPVTSTIFVVEPTRRILWGGDANGVTGIHEWLFTETPDGVRVETNESFAGDPVAADPTTMKGMLDMSLTAWLKALKIASEASTTPEGK